jgi:hypothetical protein
VGCLEHEVGVSSFDCDIKECAVVLCVLCKIYYYYIKL